MAIWAAPAAITGAAIATGSVATAVTAAALAPLAVVAAPAYYFWRKHAKAEDRDRIEAEFSQRRLGYPTLGGGGAVRGSHFFPIVPNPQKLVVDYRHQGGRFTVELPLEALAGLHVAASSGGS